MVETLDDVVATLRTVGPWLGPLISGFALLLTASAAWVTYLLIARRTVQNAWIDTYRVLNAEFWKDDNIAAVRNWITSEIAYADVERVLNERLKAKENRLTSADNEVLEKIDKLCALLVRIQFFESSNMTKRQRELWNKTYGNFWINKINQRTALRNYISEYWPNVRLDLTRADQTGCRAYVPTNPAMAAAAPAARPRTRSRLLRPGQTR